MDYSDKSLSCLLVNSPGYIVLPCLSARELSLARDFINNQWLSVLQQREPRAYHLAYNHKYDITRYMELCAVVDHSNTWTKLNRMLPADFSTWFSSTSFFQRLKRLFGNFSISDEENLGRPNYYWRLVRPSAAEDVGPYHRDSWFWELNEQHARNSFYRSRWKVWVAVHTEVGLNGLLVEPSSHTRSDIEWHGERRHGIIKPVLKTQPSSFTMRLLDVPSGHCVLFHDNLIHGGSINKGTLPRVSFEFTILSPLAHPLA
jgi:hypothetical protein